LALATGIAVNKFRNTCDLSTEVIEHKVHALIVATRYESTVSRMGFFPSGQLVASLSCDL
jgi:hypothetical protein